MMHGQQNVKISDKYCRKSIRPCNVQCESVQCVVSKQSRIMLIDIPHFRALPAVCC